MSYRICQFRGHTARCTENENIPLPYIPELPWGRTVCNPKDLSACDNIRFNPYSSVWKNRLSVVPQIFPTNSRPIPNNRRWRAPGRPLLPLSSDPSCNTINSPDCDPNTYNSIENGLIPPGNINGTGDYLEYNNPNAVLNDNGGITSCLGGPAFNFYSGPGWKSSRVHGKSKSRALPRPIKHWRKQLFPRQYTDSHGFPRMADNNSIIDSGNIVTRANRANIRMSDIFERPGGAIATTDIILNELSKKLLFSCIPIFV